MQQLKRGTKTGNSNKEKKKEGDRRFSLDPPNYLRTRYRKKTFIQSNKTMLKDKPQGRRYRQRHRLATCYFSVNTTEEAQSHNVGGHTHFLITGDAVTNNREGRHMTHTQKISNIVPDPTFKQSFSIIG